MSKYDEMSGFEINEKILNLTAGGLVINIRKHKLHSKLKALSSVVIFAIESEDGETLNGRVDYINNPADMWPLIDGNNISITRYPNGDAMTFIQGGGFIKFKHESKDALRSAAITFLMMKDAEQ